MATLPKPSVTYAVGGTAANVGFTPGPPVASLTPLVQFDVGVCPGTVLGATANVFRTTVKATGAESYVVQVSGLQQKSTYTVGVRSQAAGGTNSSAWAMQTFTTSPQYDPLPYVNPLSQVSGLVCERVDQGVDFAGTGGPILALGNGVMIETNGSGWPGGPYMAYRLTDGPAAGLVIYMAEDLTLFNGASLSEGAQAASVTAKLHAGTFSFQPHTAIPGTTLVPGSVVKTGQQIATVYNGPDGIEMGWGRSTDGLVPESQQPECGSISGANLPAGGGGTLIGRNFDELLRRLGVPQANNLNATPGGILPSGWPQWF